LGSVRAIPEQPADAEASFKLSDSLGDSGLSDAELSRGAGDRPGFDDADCRCVPAGGEKERRSAAALDAPAPIGRALRRRRREASRVLGAFR